MILYLIIAPTLLKPKVWHELIRIVKIKDVDIEAVACVHNLQYRFSTGTNLFISRQSRNIHFHNHVARYNWKNL